MNQNISFHIELVPLLKMQVGMFSRKKWILDVHIWYLNSSRWWSFVYSVEELENLLTYFRFQRWLSRGYSNNMMMRLLPRNSAPEVDEEVSIDNCLNLEHRNLVYYFSNELILIYAIWWGQVSSVSDLFEIEIKSDDVTERFLQIQENFSTKQFQSDWFPIAIWKYASGPKR